MAAKDQEAPAEPEAPPAETGKDLEVAGPTDLDTMSEEDLLAEMALEAKEAKKDLDFQNDVQLPGLILIQATSGYVNDGIAKPGDLLHNQSHESYTEFDVIIARVYKTRVLFGSELGERPECTSPDAIGGFGDPGDSLPKKAPNGGGACETCPQANWREGGSCKLRYNYLGIPLGKPDDPIEDWKVQLPVGFQMQGTSAKVATRLNSVLIAQDYYWSSVITLMSVPMENDKGKYRGWGFKKSRETTMEEKIFTFKIARMLRESASRISVVGQDEAPPADDDIPF